MDYNNYANTPYYNPYYLQPQVMPNQISKPQQLPNQFIYIQGKEAAKAYPVQPGTTLLFLDDQNPYVYRKKTDIDGRTIEFKVFRLEEEVDVAETKEATNFATKDDLQNLSSSIFTAIDDLKGMIRNNKSYQGKKGNYNGEPTYR